MRLLAQLAPDASACRVHPIPAGLKLGHHEEQGLKWTDTDRYGKPLTYTTSTDLRRLKLPEDLAPWNEAILAFLRTLPPDKRLILYWC